MNFCPFSTFQQECRKDCGLYSKEQDCCSFQIISKVISGLPTIEQMELEKLEKRIEYLKSKL